MRRSLAANLVEFTAFLITRLFNAMTKVMYGGLDSTEALAALGKKEVGGKDGSGETASSNPINRIKGLTGGCPELN